MLSEGDNSGLGRKAEKKLERDRGLSREPSLHPMSQPPKALTTCCYERIVVDPTTAENVASLQK